jgi:anaerobic selenocysteine-containing dehydrogenase
VDACTAAMAGLEGWDAIRSTAPSDAVNPSKEQTGCPRRCKIRADVNKRRMRERKRTQVSCSGRSCTGTPSWEVPSRRDDAGLSRLRARLWW